MYSCLWICICAVTLLEYVLSNHLVASGLYIWNIGSSQMGSGVDLPHRRTQSGSDCVQNSQSLRQCAKGKVFHLSTITEPPLKKNPKKKTNGQHVSRQLPSLWEMCVIVLYLCHYYSYKVNAWSFHWSIQWLFHRQSIDTSIGGLHWQFLWESIIDTILTICLRFHWHWRLYRKFNCCLYLTFHWLLQFFCWCIQSKWKTYQIQIVFIQLQSCQPVEIHFLNNLPQFLHFFFFKFRRFHCMHGTFYIWPLILQYNTIHPDWQQVQL